MAAEHGQAEGKGSCAEREDDQLDRPQPSQRQGEPDRGGERREHDDSVEGDVDARREAWQMRRYGRIPDEADEDDAERGGPAPAQYGGCSAHQGPSALNAFQNAVFAGASSSASSTSGVTSAWIVGVKR